MSIAAAAVATGCAAVSGALLPRPSAGSPEVSPPSRALRPAWVVVAGATGVVVLATSVSGLHLALALLLAATAAWLSRMARRRHLSRAADRRAEEVLGICEAMASDLAVGQPPLRALARAASEWSDFAPVAVAGEMGADVPALLRELASRPGAGQLRTLAATWQVAHETGSGLAAALDQAAATIRGQHRTARLVASELAAAHATARMLAVLPFVVLLLGVGVGGDPVGCLLGTAAGVGCLGLGLLLSFTGLWWLERIADQVLRR